MSFIFSLTALRVVLVALMLVFANPMGLATAGETNEYAIGVDGLACPFCAYGIEKQLNRIAGVEVVSTDIESGTVSVTMEEGIVLEESAARKAVEDAGFTLRSFKRPAASE